MPWARGMPHKRKTIFNISILLHCLTAFVVVLLIEGSGYFLFNGFLVINPARLAAAKLIYHFLTVSIFFSIVSTPYLAVLLAHENMLFITILGIVEAILKLGIALYITHTGVDKLVCYASLMASMSVLLVIVRCGYCHRKYTETKLDLINYFDRALFIEMIHFSAWSCLGCASSMIGANGQNILVNIFFDTSINASQGVAGQVRGQLSVFSSLMIQSLNPPDNQERRCGEPGAHVEAKFHRR